MGERILCFEASPLIPAMAGWTGKFLLSACGVLTAAAEYGKGLYAKHQSTECGNII